MKFPLLVLFATGALSAPFNLGLSLNSLFFEEDCSDPRLSNEATSIFEYDGETVTTVQGSTTDQTGLKLRARIYIHPQGACKYRMQIINPELLVKSKNQDFQIAPESAKYARELRAQDLIFQTSRGRITKLFPAAGEALHVLNIKRGILSTLQLQIDAKEEVDVNGYCKVEVSQTDQVIIKKKDLSQCNNRAHNELGLQTATFAHSKMPIKPLDSKSTCAYRMAGNKIQSVECDETHIFRPFSAGYTKPAGAMTTVKQTMRLAGLKAGAKFAIETKNEIKPVNLIFEHEAEAMKPENSIVDRIDSVMEVLVKKGALNAKQSSAHEFVHLVNLVRKLDSKRMRPVMDRYFNHVSSDAELKSVYRQYFLDALTYCGTPTCVTTVHNVIISGDVTGEYRNMFLQGISLVAKPTKQMVRDVFNIAKTKPSRQAFLSLGTLINRYCKQESADCAYGSTNPVSQAGDFLYNKLGSTCGNDDDHERVEEILMTIKAIGNAGMPVSAISSLVKCAAISKHMNLTIAAFDALRRMPCNEERLVALTEILEGVEGDVERRIHAYLTMMNCPTEKKLQSIVRQLENEKSSQVGSFMLSHLRNIQESSDPKHSQTQVWLNKFLKVKDLTKFDLPFTKFSKAFEASLYSSYLKSGASVNGHLIYNTDSFVPKSSLVSMSANILDVPVDVFEMAARVEGVERLVEEIFGPYGYFPDDTVMKIFNVNYSKEDLEKLRTRRSVEQNFDDKINRIHEEVNKKKAPAGFLSMKVLGHEMRVFSYDDIQWAADEIDNMNVIELLLKVAKGGRKTFTKSIMFLEMTHSVPTGVGLPLKLKLTGSAVGSLELNGKFDVRNMFWGPMALEVKGSVKPSAVVEVAGQMGVHSHYYDTGIFVNSSYFTSSEMKGSVIYKEGQQLKINVEAPEKPIEFVNISSTPFTYVNEDIKLIEGGARRITPDFCLNSKMVLGLGLCTRMSVPVAFRDYEAPYFPLSGPASFGMKLVKADPKLTTYQFLVSLSKKAITSGSELIGTFEVGTPGATYSRGLAGVIKYKETNKVRQLTIGSVEASSETQLTIAYQNDTNRFEVDFGTNMITKKPIKMRFLYFNESTFLAKETGILASAEYDWYKFQHVTKYVRKLSPTKSFLLHTRTTYWPQKHVTGEIEYSPEKDTLSMRFDANQFNQRVEMDGKFVSTETSKGLDFTATHISSNKKISFYTGIVNTEEAKKFVFNVKTASSKPVSLVWGYFSGKGAHTVRFDATVFGKTAALFADYSNLRSGYHGMKFGALVEGHSIGLVTSYNNVAKLDKEACVVAYYNDKRPAKICLTLKEKKLTLSGEVMKRTAAVSFGLTTTQEMYVLNSVLNVQGIEMMKNVVELKLKSLLENEFKMTTTAGKQSIMTRMYTTKESSATTLFGFEGQGFGQVVKLQTTYSMSTKDDVTVRGIIVEGWVNKKLPVNFTFVVENSDKMKGVRAILKILDYTAQSSMIYAVPKTSEYVFITDMSMTKKELVILGSKTNDVVIWTDKVKAYKSSWEVTVWNKKFKYGFDVTYEKRSTDVKSIHAVTFGADYARNRRSAVTFTVGNSEKFAELLIDVSYLPGRLLQHVFIYDKVANKFEVSIEFLPKMFVKFTGRLDKVEGWKFTTDMTLSWENYERTLQAVAAYISKADLKGLNFAFSALNQRFFIGSEYNKKAKSISFSASAFGRSARLTSRLDVNRGIGNAIFSMQRMEGNKLIMKDIFEATVAFSKTRVSLELKAGQTSILKTIGTLEKTKGSLEMMIMGRAIVKLQGLYNAEQKRGTLDLFVLGKQRFQMVGKYNKEQNTFLLSFDLLKKGTQVVFGARWNNERKEVTISAEFMHRIFGFVARFDPVNYAAGFHVFYRKTMLGWAAAFDRQNSLVVFNLKVTPKTSVQFLLQVINDRIISLSVERKTGTETFKEAVFKYELTSSASKIFFEWNKDTVKGIKDMIVPAVTKALKDVAKLSKAAAEIGQDVSFATLNKLVKKSLEMINEADRRFDNFDFVAARNKAGEMIMLGLTKTAQLGQQGLKLTSKSMVKLASNIPKVVSAAQRYSKKALEFSRVAMRDGIKFTKNAYKALESVTEAGVPVAKLAIKLAKEFKIQGKTTEQIVKSFVELVERLVSSYKTNVSKQLNKLTTDAKKYLESVKMPLSDKKVVEVIKEYVAKIKAINIEEKTRELTRKLLEYQVMGAQVKAHLQKIRKVINNLPEELKKAAISLIKAGRGCVKEVEKVLKKVKAAFTPLTACVRKITTSVRKHFGPLVTKGYKKVMDALKAEITNPYTPLKAAARKMIRIIFDFTKPLLKPIGPLYLDIKSQVRALELLEYELGNVFDVYTREYADKVATAYRDMYRRAKTSLKTYFEDMKKTSSMTLEEMAEKLIDRSAAALTETVAAARKVYNDRAKIYVDVKARTIRVRNLVSEIISVALSRPVEEILEVSLRYTGKYTELALREAAKLLTQISEMDVATPLKKAWEDMDLLNHLNRYGVNAKITEMITAAKKVNVTVALMRALKTVTSQLMQVRKTLDDVYGYISKESMRVVEMIKAIPKKDFETWYREVQTAVITSQKALTKLITDAFAVVRRNAVLLKTKAEALSKTFMEKYGKPIKNMIHLLRLRAALVYDDVRYDVAVVANIYKGLVYGIAKERYAAVKKTLRTKYDELYKDISAFYRKYEDKTWEQIGNEVIAVGKNVYAKIEQRYAKVEALTKKAIAAAKDVYQTGKKITVENYAKLEKVYLETVKPKVVELYEKIASYVKAKSAELKEKTVSSYNKLVTEVKKIYEANKNLSIRQLTVRGRKLVMDAITKYIEAVKAAVKEHYGKIYTQVMHLKTKFMKGVLPVVKGEVVSIINQALKGSVLLAEEAIKAFRPQYQVMMKYAEEYLTKGKALVKKYYAQAVELSMKFYKNAKESSVEMYEKAIARLEVEYKKIVAYVEEFIKKVKNHPKYQEIIKHGSYLKLEKFVKNAMEVTKRKMAELKVKVAELKNHPKIAEIKQKIEELKKHATVKEIVASAKQLRTSLMFTLNKIQEKLAPQITELKAKISSIPDLAKAQLTSFRADPVQCFWSNVGKIETAVKELVEYEWRTLKTEVPKAVKKFFAEVTDEKTKEMYNKITADALKMYTVYYKVLASLPQKIKAECTKFCVEQLEKVKQQYAKLVAQWKNSPLYPIFTNKIWKEIADEVFRHEIVVELRKLAKAGLERFFVAYAKAVKDIKAYVQTKRAELMTKYNEMLTKFNSFIDTTTLEHIVFKTVELYERSMSVVVKNVKELSAKVTEMAKEYQSKVTAFGKKQYEEMKSYFDKKYPVVAAELKTQYAKAVVVVKAYAMKIAEKSQEMKTKAAEKVMDMWEKSSTKKMLETIKTMTVGETLAVLMKVPGDAKKVYKDVEEMIISRYHVYIQPRVKMTVDAVKFVGNEINETIVFVIRYYRLKDNIKQLYDQGHKKLIAILPRVPVVAKRWLKSASKESLRAVHSSMVYMDNFDMKAYADKMRSYVPDVKKYVNVKVNDGGAVLSVSHPFEITPSFSHHANKAKDTVKTYTNKVTKKTIAVTRALLEKLRARTLELRKDLNESYLAHAKLGQHLKSRGAALQKLATEQKETLVQLVKDSFFLAKGLTVKAVNEGADLTKSAFKYTKTAAVSILNSDSLPEAYQKARAFSNQAVQALKKRFPVPVRIANYVVANIKKSIVQRVRPYYVATKISGLRAAYILAEKELMVAVRNAKEVLMITIRNVKNSLAPEDFEALSQYANVHTNILKKYGKRLFQAYRWNKIMLDRFIRRSKMSLYYRYVSPLTRRANPIRTYAMIFGKNHVMTFDGKFYEFPKYAKSTCTYLLARDFHNGKFTILSQENAIITETPALKVTIHKNGHVEGTIKTTKAGITRSRRVNGLPIETEDGGCKRWMNYIKCTFKQGVTINCDVDHFLCTVELSGWHYGKSQGILGTNNREMYDEFRLPNGRLSGSTEQLANSWLVSSDSECVIKPTNNEAPACNKAPSERCVELFKSKTSPLAGHFSKVDPLAFLKACQIDTADCESTEAYETAHCHSVAAYRTMLKMQGSRAAYVKDCKRTINGKKHGDKWTQKGRQAVDIVVVMSARKQAQSAKKFIASMLYNANKKIAALGLNTRYALISFGAKSKMRYGSRSHTFNGQYFSTENTIATAIKTMEYTGDSKDTNDYNDAILRATQQQFRPGASKLILLFNFDKYASSWYGPSSDEVKFALKYEANATLFAFDKFDFSSYQDGIYTALGMTRSNVFMTPGFRVVSNTKNLPQTPFTRYVHCAGGLFGNNFSKSTIKAYTSALSFAAKQELTSHKGKCHRCVMGRYNLRCRSDVTATC